MREQTIGFITNFETTNIGSGLGNIRIDTTTGQPAIRTGPDYHFITDFRIKTVFGTGFDNGVNYSEECEDSYGCHH